MKFFTIALLVLKKDFAIELKSYEILSTTVFFAVSCVAIFSFAFVKEGQAVVDAAAGILWIAIAFSGTLALGRTFERERYGETLKALLMAPAPRPAIYLGKLLGIVSLGDLAHYMAAEQSFGSDGMTWSAVAHTLAAVSAPRSSRPPPAADADAAE